MKTISKIAAVISLIGLILCALALNAQEFAEAMVINKPFPVYGYVGLVLTAVGATGLMVGERDGR